MASPLQLFNLQWYLMYNPDVAEAVEKGLIDAFEHFQQFGNVEGRSTSPLFNPEHYLAQNPDIAAAVARGDITAYDHFVNHGANEGRSPSAMFDEAFYLTQNPDVAEAVGAGVMTAVQHFLMYGQAEPRPFSPHINLGDYLGANPDVAEAVQNGFMTAMDHLMMYGVGEPRDLGNGVNLGDFANDPAFSAALESGNMEAALGRVGDVAPFLPSFQPPAGWTPPADTPIPTDFVPPEGVKLIIPEGVVVPEGTELPDSFAPVEPVTPPVTPPGGGGGGADIPLVNGSWGILGPTALNGEYLYPGTNNPANGFIVAKNTVAGIELGLDVRYKQDAAEVAPAYDNVFVVDADRAGDVRFAYSVASTTSSALDLDKYDFKLRINTDFKTESKFLEFNLVRQVPPGQEEDARPSIYDWNEQPSGPRIITDDGGDQEGKVTQNIQALHWYLDDDQPFAPVGSYDVQLQAYLKGTATLVAESALVVQVQNINFSNSYRDLKETSTQDGFLFAGTTNPSNGFVVSRNEIAKIELGLDVRFAGDGTEKAPLNGKVVAHSKSNVFNVEATQDVRFAYSVANTASEPAEINLTAYDYKLKIDRDSTEGTDFLVFHLVKQDTSNELGGKADPNPSLYEWVEEVKSGTGRVIMDDGGAAHVTQNIQAIDWYLADSMRGLKDGDIYNVQLQAYSKTTGNLEASSEIIVTVGAATTLQGVDLMLPPG